MRLEFLGAVGFRNIVHTGIALRLPKNVQAAAMRARRKDVFAHDILGYTQTKVNEEFGCPGGSFDNLHIKQDEAFADFEIRCADWCTQKTGWPACAAFTVETQLDTPPYCKFFQHCPEPMADSELGFDPKRRNIYLKDQDSPNGRFWNVLMWCWICV